MTTRHTTQVTRLPKRRTLRQLLRYLDALGEDGHRMPVANTSTAPAVKGGAL